jgi:hypothetical protein
MSKSIKKMYREKGLTPPKGKGIHTKKFHKCVVSVKSKKKEQGKSEEDQPNPYAVCMSSMGREEAVRKEHRRPGYEKPEKHDITVHVPGYSRRDGTEVKPFSYKRRA